MEKDAPHLAAWVGSCVMTVMFLLMPTVRGLTIGGTLTLKSDVTIPMGNLCIW